MNKHLCIVQLLARLRLFNIDSSAKIGASYFQIEKKTKQTLLNAARIGKTTSIGIDIKKDTKTAQMRRGGGEMRR
jgi:hypothetical protein